MVADPRVWIANARPKVSGSILCMLWQRLTAAGWDRLEVNLAASRLVQGGPDADGRGLALAFLALFRDDKADVFAIPKLPEAILSPWVA